MPAEIVTIPCLSDNYAYLVHDPGTGQVAVIDVPDAAPVRAELRARGWPLTHILITHHHHDHIGGVDALRHETGARVTGAAADAHRLPTLDLAVADGDRVPFGDGAFAVIDVPGHTVGHVAYHLPDSRAVFTADSLMALGCGRLFEGTAAQMWASLRRLRDLPPDTRVCSGHEYTQANAKFARTIDPGNADLILRAEEIARLRAAGLPTVPSTLDLERKTNPFLRPDDPALRRALGLETATDTEVFAEIRARKDRF